MKIKDKILMMPVWKIAAVSLVVLLSSLLLIEHFFVAKVFAVFDRGITYFERIAKEDNDEVDKDMREYKQRQAYNDAISQYRDADLKLHLYSSPLEHACFYAAMIKHFEAMRSLPYVKQYPHVREDVERSIHQHKLSLKKQLATHPVDVTQCERKPS